nr:nitroreductase family protein [Methylomonas koyamae]
MNNFNHNGKPNRWAPYDTGAAALSICIQATALGLAAHQMGGFDADLARQSFGLPEDCTPMAMIAVGYPADARYCPRIFRPASAANAAGRLWSSASIADTGAKPSINPYS